MKNLLQLIIVTLVACFVFSSCGKQMSITKRKYNKGYYVSHSHKRSDVKPQPSVANIKAERLAPAAVNIAPPNITEPEVTASALNLNTASETEKEITNTKEQTNNIAKKFYKVKPVEKLIPSKFYTSELKKKMQSSADQDALSLLWIVIVVLLILYLIGLLAGGWGLGWAIHILVIVAVVLLILWLLRIL